ncbi:MAG: prepilin-type N-terminal cleavage/methylation domain-containing protein [Lachnospiraceae bacterium]|nr:prepilin-type N-terminal cleavage/methylation domain-containing protein [Lachnospiraceae bacterium]
MKNYRMNNNGFTLIETTVCFILLGILLVAAAQVIASSSEVYYYSKSIDYGAQAAQVVATEIRGDIENAVIKKCNFGKDNSIPYEADGKCVYISPDKKTISFINNKGNQISYSLKPDSIGGTGDMLVRTEIKIYDDYFELLSNDKKGKLDIKYFSSQYVGMNYSVKSIKFAVFDKTSHLPTNMGNAFQGAGDYPVIVMELTVSNPQYGEYDCTEYIPLYNYYGTTNLIYS